MLLCSSMYLRMAQIPCLLLIVFFCGALIGNTYAQPSPQFHYLTVEEGLTNNWVKAIYRDSTYLWVGTFNDLNRYDGQRFATFLKEGPSGLSDNFIQCITRDKDGNLWVGTFSGGLNKYDPLTETFASYTHHSDQNSIRSNRVESLLPTSEGLWIGTSKGLDYLDLQTGHFSHIDFPSTGIPTEGADFIASITRTRQGEIWLGTKSGIWIYHPQHKTFSFLSPETHNLSHGYVTSIFEDKYGDMWVGTWGGGLNLKKADHQTFTHFTTHTPDGISHNSILSMVGDGEDALYIATEGGGLNRFDLDSRTFTPYQPDLTDTRSINSPSVHSLFFDDAQGILWAGTYNGGVNYFSKWDKPFKLIKAKTGGLQDNHVTCFAEDKEGNIWVGTDEKGLNKWNPETNAWT